jgi:hypothetical protein
MCCLFIYDFNILFLSLSLSYSYNLDLLFLKTVKSGYPILGK